MTEKPDVDVTVEVKEPEKPKTVETETVTTETITPPKTVETTIESWPEKKPA